MIAFIKEHRGVCGVEPICRVLQIAPSTFYAHLAVEDDPDKASDRAKRDAELRPEMKRGARMLQWQSTSPGWWRLHTCLHSLGTTLHTTALRQDRASHQWADTTHTKEGMKADSCVWAFWALCGLVT